MKTAISIPPKVFESAEKFAEKMGVSRSQLYVTAIKNYLDSHLDDSVTAKLNEVYAQTDSKLDPALKKLQAKSISKDGW
jgi:metal-responsive CopG/Arc/MetJ family transcriptional regulator